ncbi:hypothetical protein PQX77_008017 [Marasmius sp. AFHP31]|nr:hypothetical protein PQX77_008017 [Marasmius sp. AFHP31]
MRPADERFRRSNYIPSDAEKAQLTAILEKELHVDESYDREIISLQERLAKLEAGKQATTAIIACYRSALSAHRKLPAELWELSADLQHLLSGAARVYLSRQF